MRTHSQRTALQAGSKCNSKYGCIQWQLLLRKGDLDTPQWPLHLRVSFWIINAINKSLPCPVEHEQWQ